MIRVEKTKLRRWWGKIIIIAMRGRKEWQECG
jgi:hypothetical protein